jgi:hypothetical protein
MCGFSFPVGKTAIGYKIIKAIMEEEIFLVRSESDHCESRVTRSSVTNRSSCAAQLRISIPSKATTKSRVWRSRILPHDSGWRSWKGREGKGRERKHCTFQGKDPGDHYWDGEGELAAST